MIYDHSLWIVVLINVVLFGMFLYGFLQPRKKPEGRSMGVVTAFIVALFTEMYGFPLAIYLLVSYFGMNLGPIEPFAHVQGHMWDTLLRLPELGTLLACQIGSIVILGGLIIMGLRWRQIHRARGELVTSGLYRYVRHPQYAGLLLITVGMLIQWPTLITIVMWPLLMFKYLRLAKGEEPDRIEAFGESYLEYRKQVPAFFPGLSRRLNRQDPAFTGGE